MAYSDDYIKSNDIRVFPCAYRGQGGSTIFDAEARLNTEFNLTHTGNNLHKTYIVEIKENPAVFKFVINGYYFEIKNTNKSKLSGKYLCINLDSSKAISTGFNTSFLTSWENNNDSLDIQDGGAGDYYFTGLKISSSIESGNAGYIKLFNTNGSECLEYCLPKIYAGTGTSALIAGATNTNVASGTNSIAVGLGTKADKDNLTAIGKYNSTDDSMLFAVGNGTDSSARSNAFAVSSEEISCNKQVTAGAGIITNSIINTEENNIINFSREKLTFGNTADDLDIVGDNININARNTTANNNVNIAAGKYITFNAATGQCVPDPDYSGTGAITSYADINGNTSLRLLGKKSSIEQYAVDIGQLGITFDYIDGHDSSFTQRSSLNIFTVDKQNIKYKGEWLATQAYVRDHSNYLNSKLSDAVYKHDFDIGNIYNYKIVKLFLIFIATPLYMGDIICRAENNVRQECYTLYPYAFRKEGEPYYFRVIWRENDRGRWELALQCTNASDQTSTSAWYDVTASWPVMKVKFRYIVTDFFDFTLQ